MRQALPAGGGQRAGGGVDLGPAGAAPHVPDRVRPVRL